MEDIPAARPPHYTWEQCAERYPRIVKCVAWVLIGSTSEAACCVRDYRDGMRYGSEAVSHSGLSPYDRIVQACAAPRKHYDWSVRRIIRRLNDGTLLPPGPRLTPMQEISKGTLDMGHVIVALFDAWKKLDLRRARIFEAANANEIALIGEEGEDPDYTQWMYDEIVKELETFAPEGYFVGQHPASSADIGVWPTSLRPDA